MLLLTIMLSSLSATYSHGNASNGMIPTAIFHGLNDNCTNNMAIVKHLSQATNNSYVKCIEVGNGRRDTWFTDVMDQAQVGCSNLKMDANFSMAKQINVLGFSQGGIIARYLL